MSPRNPKLHKTYLTVEPVDYEKTVYDDDLKEPFFETKKDKAFKIGGQVNNIGYYAYGSSSRATRAGEEQSLSAYIIFSARDCKKKNWRPAPGDVITKLYIPSEAGKDDDFQTIDVHLEVTTVQPASIYRGLPRAFWVYYSDVSPREKARNER